MACTVSSLDVPRARRLLIVQSNEFVARSLARYLGVAFDSVRIATTPGEAEALLDDPIGPPTHLVCGQRFGTRSSLGTELIPTWRARCPALERVVMATAEEVLPDHLTGVDALFRKPADLTSLLLVLQ